MFCRRGKSLSSDIELRFSFPSVCSVVTILAQLSKLQIKTGYFFESEILWRFVTRFCFQNKVTYCWLIKWYSPSWGFSRLASYKIFLYSKVIYSLYWIYSTECMFDTFFLLWPPLLTHCKCSRLLLHLITLGDTHTTFYRTPLDDGSAPRKDLYWYYATVKIDLHALGGIRTRSPNNRGGVDLRLTPPGHRDPVR